MSAVGRAGRASRDAAAGDGIQFVAPRIELFGSSHLTVADAETDLLDGTDPFGDDDERPVRWSTIAAALGVLALIAVGVIAAAPWHDDAAVPAEATPTSTATPAPTTTSAPTTAVGNDAAAAEAAGDDAVLVVSTAGDAAVAAAASGGPPIGYLLEPALLSDVAVIAAEAPARDLALITEPRSWLDVWVTPGATALVGAWLAVEVDPGPSGGGGDGETSERVAVGDGIGVLSEADGLTRLQILVADRSITVTARGWTDDALIAFTASLTLANGRPVYSAPPADGAELAVSRLSSGWGFANEMRAQAELSVRYATPDGHVLEVSTRPADGAEDRALLELLLEPVPGEPVSGPGSIVVHDGRNLTIGTDVGSGWPAVLFTEHGRTVTITGDVDVATLVELSERARLRPGAPTEWDDLVSDLLLDGSLDAVGGG